MSLWITDILGSRTHSSSDWWIHSPLDQWIHPSQNHRYSSPDEWIQSPRNQLIHPSSDAGYTRPLVKGYKRPWSRIHTSADEGIHSPPGQWWRSWHWRGYDCSYGWILSLCIPLSATYFIRENFFTVWQDFILLPNHHSPPTRPLIAIVATSRLEILVELL